MTETHHAPSGVRDVVIVGGGPAAHRLADSLHARDTERRLRVTVVGEEAHEPYDRVALSTRLADAATDLTLQPSSMWGDGHVRLITGERVVGIDRDARTATTSTGRALHWDDLVLATGSSAPVPDIPGHGHARVYRTIDDVDALVAETRDLAERHGRPAQVVVAGGGLLGLEAAGGLARLGAHAAVVHSGGWLMSAQLDEGAGRALGRIIAGQGIGLHLGARPAEVIVEDDAVVAVQLTNGRLIACDLIVFAIGISPRDELARGLGLQLGPRGGVAIDTSCAASAPHIWAIGEVASFEGRCTGLVAPANAMAEVVADRLLGGAAEFTTVDDATKLKLSGVDVASFGDALARTEQALEIVYADPARGLYQKLVVTDDAKTLLGGIFVGDASPYASLRPLLGTQLSAEPAA